MLASPETRADEEPPAAAAPVEPPAEVAPAPPPPPPARETSTWHPRRELSFGTADWVITGAAVGGVFVGAFVVPSGKRWRGGVLFDEAARDALRLDSMAGRYGVRDVSDVGVSLASTWPYLVDALVTAWWYRGRADLALDMALVSSEAFAIAAAAQSMGNLVASRERPFGRLCGTDIPQDTLDCQPDVRYRSFFSGHATLAFTGASLVCTQHMGLGLLGPTGDILSCVTGYTVAAATGVFRVMSDMHYASDAILGALVGTAAGVAVPLLHFRKPRAAEAAAGALDMRIGTVGQGLGVVGTF